MVSLVLDFGWHMLRGVGLIVAPHSPHSRVWEEGSDEGSQGLFCMNYSHGIGRQRSQVSESEHDMGKKNSTGTEAER